jgi:hypothetical protein
MKRAFALQNLFSIIRGRNGFNEKPELTAFLGALRSVAVSGLARPDSAVRNCEDDGCAAALTTELTPLGVSSEVNSVTANEQVCKPGERQSPQGTDCSFSVLEEATEYVGGFVLKRSGALDCDSCKKVMTASEPSGVHLLHKIHSYTVIGLIQPSAAALHCFVAMEALFTAQLPSFFLQPAPAAHVAKLFAAKIHFPACDHHSSRVQNKVFLAFARLRLHHWCREQMRSLRAAAVERRVVRKVKKFNSS